MHWLSGPSVRLPYSLSVVRVLRWIIQPHSATLLCLTLKPTETHYTALQKLEIICKFCTPWFPFHSGRGKMSEAGIHGALLMPSAWLGWRWGRWWKIPALDVLINGGTELWLKNSDLIFFVNSFSFLCEPLCCGWKQPTPPREEKKPSESCSVIFWFQLCRDFAKVNSSSRGFILKI